MTTDLYAYTRPEIESRLALIEEAISDTELSMSWYPIWNHASLQTTIQALEDEREILEDMLYELWP